ncbi:PrsW family glutamic-type intramembrane protease [Streptomyces sp. NBC_01373]|uniref:PrsW family glutamic-type intramembrane protease n=1 Tax=Streptomyces sp. NBC_01373 TaxID=2903843 RepID=UPI0022577406|nr:PrsW family glutamic-type intramembrane protease [Streptomyces sp. NBC_01373]MCX4701142.1 PrsW family intramembrane metalloprotease [Streptomyces sp. NBC_01373]
MTTAPGALPPPPPRPPARVPRHGLPTAIVVALVMSAAYGIAQILFWATPDVTSPTSLMVLWLKPLPGVFEATRILLLVGWGLAAVLGLSLALRRGAPPADPEAHARTVRAHQYGILAALTLPYTTMAFHVLFRSLPLLLLCLPTTAAALLLVHRLQLFRRLPGRLLLAAFGSGALIAAGYGLTMNVWAWWYAPGYLLDWSTPRDTVRALFAVGCFNSALFTELGKAAVVAALYFLCRRHFDGVVSGVVLGAAVGLGFNLTETVAYMSDYPGALGSAGPEAQPPVEFWTRQVVGLMAVHVAFTALVGAGFGAARRLRERRDRALVVGAGVLAAVGGHFWTDIALGQLAKQRDDWFSDSDVVGLLVGVPLMTALTSGVFVVLYVLVLRQGLRAQRLGLTHALHAEAAEGGGAVTEPEIGLLLSPRRRLLLELRVWRRDGVAGVRHLMRLQQAQLDLATQRMHRDHSGADIFVPDERPLRDHVLELKGAPMAPEPPALPARGALS